MSMYIGEALVGEGNEVAHIDLLIGSPAYDLYGETPAPASGEFATLSSLPAWLARREWHPRAGCLRHATPGVSLPPGSPRGQGGKGRELA